MDCAAAGVVVVVVIVQVLGSGNVDSNLASSSSRSCQIVVDFLQCSVEESVNVLYYKTGARGAGGEVCMSRHRVFGIIFHCLADRSMGHNQHRCWSERASEDARKK